MDLVCWGPMSLSSRRIRNQRSGHGEGTFTSLPSGQIRWRVSVLIHGQSKRLSGTAPTEKQARAAMQKAKVSGERGIAPAPARMTLGECVDLWIIQRDGMGRKTRSNYNGLLRLHILPRIGSVKLREVTPGLLRDFQMFLRTEANLGYSSRRQVHTMLNGTLGQAFGDGLLSGNPAAAPGIRPTPEKRSPDRLPMFSREEARRYLAAAQDGCNRPAEVLALLLLTGMRKGEALYLRWEAVALGESDPHLRVKGTRSQDGGQVYEEEKGKTRSSRRKVPLAQESVSWLEAVRVRTSEDLLGLGVAVPDYVFSTLRGTPYRPDNLDRVHTAVCKRAGIRRLPIHALRHTYASLAAADGMKIEVLSAILGHESAAFTMDQYRHLYPEELRAVSLNLKLPDGES